MARVSNGTGASQVTLYVSPAGNDRWSGTHAIPTADGRDGPVATIGRARDLVRAMKKKGMPKRPVKVLVRGGTYFLKETLTFTPADSGNETSPIVYTAYPGEMPVLSGGRVITGWKVGKHKGQVCWTTQLPEVATGRWNFTQLFVNGVRRDRPRLPKTGYYRFTGVAGWRGSARNWRNGPDRANFAPGQIKRWTNLDDVTITTYQLWFDTHHRIRKLDEKKRTVYFRAKSLGSLKDEKQQFARFFAENVFEALDTPGEWYLDRRSGRLYYLPLPGEDPETTEVIAPVLETLVCFQGTPAAQKVRCLRMENLDFRHAEWVLPPDNPGAIQAAYSVPGAVLFDGAEDCVLYGCSISRISQYAVEFFRGSSGNQIVACTMHDLGAGGVKIGHEALDRNDETTGHVKQITRPIAVGPMRTTVADCTIHDAGKIYTSAIGIWIGNAGYNRIIHNHLFNMNYTGISCGWTWGYDPTRTVDNRIEYNHIHHFNDREILSDNGGIYTLGIQPGTTIRGNVIHDVSCYGYGGWGIYPDEGSSGIILEDNLTYRTKGPGFFTHFGRDNIVRNNIFALAADSHFIPASRLEDHRSTIAESNIIYWDRGRLWFGKWDILHSQFRNNVFWDASGQGVDFTLQPLTYWQARGQLAGCVTADPLFQDPRGGDFSLRADSPAPALGFRPFDPAKAGPRVKGIRPVSFADYPYRDGAAKEIVRTVLEVVKPIFNPKNGPGRVRLTATNMGEIAATGTITLKIGREMGRIIGSNRFKFALRPGQAKSAIFQVQAESNAARVLIETAVKGKGLVPTLVAEKRPRCLDVPTKRLSKIDRVDRVEAALADVSAQPITIWERPAGQVKFAVAGADLAIFAAVEDPYVNPHKTPWHGSCLEIFAAMPGSDEIGQVFLQPGTATKRPTALRQKNEAQAAAPEIRLRTDPTLGGYTLQALVPLAFLNVEKRAGRFLLEFKLSVVPRKGCACVAGTLFEATMPSQRTAGFGTALIE